MNTEETERDPATHPLPRDRWRRPDGGARRVSHVEDGRVYFTGGIVPIRSLTLSEWSDVVKGWMFVSGGGE